MYPQRSWKSPTHEVEAVPPSAATVAERGGDSRLQEPTSSRDIYDGIFKDIMKNMRLGKHLFFNETEVLSIKKAFDTYKEYVSNYKKFMTLVNPLTELFGREIAMNIVLQNHDRSKIAISRRELQEKKVLMNQKISDILADKAISILKNHRRYKRQFGPKRKYGDLKSNFRQRAVQNPNVYSAYYRIRTPGISPGYYCTIERMVSSFKAIRLHQHHRRLAAYEDEMYARDRQREEEEDEEDRRRRARRGFEYDDEDHMMGLTQNGYRRAWYGGRRYGAGSDSESEYDDGY